jgi:hypothetical protein
VTLVSGSTDRRKRHWCYSLASVGMVLSCVSGLMAESVVCALGSAVPAPSVLVPGICVHLCVILAYVLRDVLFQCVGVFSLSSRRQLCLLWFHAPVNTALLLV